MTPRDRFKVAFLTRLVESGMSFDQIADHVSDLHGQVTKSAAVPGLAPPKPPTAEVGTKPLKQPSVGSVPALKLAELGLSTLRDLWGLGKDVAGSIGTAGLYGAAGAGIAGAGAGYGLGKLTDVDETDIEEKKQHELVDQYKRWAEYARQTQAMHEHVQAAGKPHFAGRY
jgi:hypothetical protein